MFYFSPMAAWSICFLKRSRKIHPMFYFLAACGALTVTCQIDYKEHPYIKWASWVGFNLLFGASLGVYMYRKNYRSLFDFLYLFSNTMSFMAAAT